MRGATRYDHVPGPELVGTSLWRSLCRHLRGETTGARPSANRPASGLMLWWFTQVPVEDGLQFPYVKWFAEKTPGGCRLGTLHGRFVDIGRQIDDWDRPIRLDLLGGLDAIHLTLQADVHEHEIRL